MTTVIKLSPDFHVPAIKEAVAGALKIDDADGALGNLKENRFANMIALYLMAGELDVGLGLQPYADELVAQLKAKTKATKPNLPKWFTSNKSVIKKSIESGLSLLRPDGMPKGKTELEKERKEMQSGKTAMEKFIGAMKSAGTQVDEMTTASDLKTAHKLALDLVAAIEDALPEVRPAPKAKTTANPAVAEAA